MSTWKANGQHKVNILEPSWLATFARKMAPEDAEIKQTTLPDKVVHVVALSLNTIHAMGTLGGFTYGSEDLYVFPRARKELIRLFHEMYQRIEGRLLTDDYPWINDTMLIQNYYYVRKKNHPRAKAGLLASSPAEMPLLGLETNQTLYAYSCDAGGTKGLIKIGRTTNKDVTKYIKRDPRSNNKDLLATTTGFASFEQELHRMLCERRHYRDEFYIPHDDVRDALITHFAWRVPNFDALFKDARARFGI